MDRRYVIFLVLSLLIWTTYIGVQFFAPPKPVAAVNEDDAEPAEEPADEKPAEEKPGDEKPGDEAAAEPQPPQDPPAADPAKAAAKTPRTLTQIGSLDPAGPYQMLLLFDSRGASLRRAELKGFHNVEDLGGHLGHLELTAAKTGGVVVGVVGRGTPASLARPADPAVGLGLKPGDVITLVDGKPADIATFESWLSRNTRPKQAIQLTVERPGAAQAIVFTATLSRRPLELVKPESRSYEIDGVTKFFGPDPLSFLLTLDTVGGKSIRPKADEIAGLPSLYDLNWELDEQGEDFVQFSFTLDDAALKAIGQSGGLKVVKKYTLAKSSQADDPAYHLDLKVEVHNLGDEPQTVAYRLQGPTGLPLEGWWYSTKLHPEMRYGAGARDIASRMAGRSHRLVGCPLIVSESKEKIEDDELPRVNLLYGDTAAPFDYLGVDTQFFAAAIRPQLAGDKPIRFRSADALPVQDVTVVPKNSLRTTNVSFLVATEAVKIEGGQPLVHDYQVFLGPKKPSILAHYQLEPLLEYGWLIFEYPAKLLGGVLHFLYWITGNYGIAIVLLTMVVRSCMVPLSLKQAKSAAMMQQLAPEVQKVKDKFPDDPMKQHAAVQELYKKHNFNPFGGCLLVFIQLPIFIGLYRCLSVDIDLREAALFPGMEWITWASNLAGPDKLFYWKDFTWDIISDEAGGWFGPFFNVLPLVTVALFLAQQKMFMPPATDEQTKMQQQMMTYMTVFMGVMFYKVPAGLCLYFITSSLWGIAERKLLAKPKPPGSGPGDESASPVSPKKTSPNGSAKTVPAKKQKKRS